MHLLSETACDYEFKSLFSIDAVLIVNSRLESEKISIGVIDSYGHRFNEIWPELNDYEIKSYDQDEQIIAQFKSCLQAMVLRKNNFERLSQTLNQSELKLLIMLSFRWV